ncbi:MAG TPA: hypothetical protein VJS43_04970 [Candidatus Acidoferrales bacterium]|nr:hypothetical protein [Candidatus Acidoferrales bacterium]
MLQTGSVAGVLLLCAPFVSARKSPATDSSADPIAPAPRAALILDNGFRDLYRLDFHGAREQFDDYQKARPADPLGKAAEAATYLYEEFSAKGVLTSKFFLDDDRFLGGVEGNGSSSHNTAFLRANAAARAAAKARLKVDPHDPQALLAITMADGMESNYDEIIEKKQLTALTLMRQAEDEAKTLLAVDPTASDAYVALGTSNYVIGCLPAYKKMFLWFGGIHGDKDRGMAELQTAADQGHFLRPFAKILLALASEREHQNARARVLLAELTKEFPENPLFAHELALLDQRDANLLSSR